MSIPTSRQKNKMLKQLLVNGTNRDLPYDGLFGFNTTQKETLKRLASSIETDVKLSPGDDNLLENREDGLYLDASLQLMQAKLAISMRSMKPSAKAVIKPMIDDRLSNRFETIHPSRYGIYGSGMVFKDIEIWSGPGVSKPPGFILFLPQVEGEQYEFNLHIDEPSGTDSVTVSLMQFLGNNTESATLVEPDIPGVGGTYSTSYTGITGNLNVGIRVVFSPGNVGAGNTFTVRTASIYRNGSKVVELSDHYEDLYTSIVSRATTGLFGPLITQDFDGWSIAHTYKVTGKNPRILWATAEGGQEVIANNTTAMRMNDETNPYTAQYASLWARTYQRNRLGEVPARAYLPGTYNMASYGSSGQPVYVNQSWEDILAFAPYGPAYFVQGNGACDGVVFATQNRGGPGEPPRINVFLWGLHAGTGASSDGVDTSNCCRVPTRLHRLGTVYAYDCSLSWSDPALNANGFWAIDSNLVMERCVARNAGLDGFNTHDFGHAALVDCEAHDCTDDGFSPHDFCTYEVWGGTYSGNNKGNIIPAFGAQGFCVGVTSSGSTGQGSAVEGDNDGGFVCLSLDGNTRPTTLLCIDCVSEGDTNGFNSAGSKSTIIMSGCSTSGASRAGLTNGEWRTSTGGRIMDAGTVFSNNEQDVVLSNPDLRTALRY